MRSLVNATSGRSHLAAMVLLALLAGCAKSGSGTYIDVTVFAETGLALDRETVVAKAAGKADFEQSIPVAGMSRLTVAPTGLATPATVTIEARGFKGANALTPTVVDRVNVVVHAGQRVSVSLHLTAACSGKSCPADQTCLGGACTMTPVAGANDGGASKDASTDLDGPAGDTTGGKDMAGPYDAPGTDSVSGSDTAMGCANGTTQSCAAPPLNKKGACGLDTATCENGQWVGCVNSKGADTCETGNDNNCNGMLNEGCPCVNGATQDCGHAAVGICKTGKATCQNGVWGSCVGNVEPAGRDCSSSMDNDCDGSPDNTIDTACKCTVGGAQACDAHPGNDGKGPCKAGTQSCVLAANKASSSWGTCSGSVGPVGADTCDPGNDNNCNGMLNEGCPCVNGAMQDCGHAAVGICKPGKATCQNSAWGACVGNVEPAARDCTSALDNNCDGKPDNTVDTVCKCAMGGSQSCNTHPGNDGKGPCKAGTQSCVVATSKATSDWGTCTGAVGPAAADTCGATSDENCNGTPHDGCACVNGQPVPCTCGSPTTCTNGVKGTCATVPTTQYTDGDGDGYGKPGTASQQCPGAAGFSLNANDCDDANASFKPGVSVCVNPNTSDQRRTCLSTGGTIMTTSCSDGCFNGNCRSDGTIGLPGYVSCTASGTPKCTTAQGCDLDTGACGLPADMLHYLKCDGQNDCPSGQTCCGFAVRGTTTADCYAGGCPDGSHRVVCDPLAPNCTIQPSVVCGGFADPSHANVCQ